MRKFEMREEGWKGSSWNIGKREAYEVALRVFIVLEVSAVQ